MINPPALNKKDIENMDLDRLQDVMVKSIYVLEASLFSQAGFENERLSNLRGMLADVETELKVEQLTPSQKVQFHSSLVTALNGSMNFMVRLHKGIADGMEAVTKLKALPPKKTKRRKLRHSRLDKIKDRKKAEVLAELKDVIRQKISEELTES